MPSAWPWPAPVPTSPTTNPASPTIVGTHNTPGFAADVAVAVPHVYVADGLSGLQVIPAQCSAPSLVELLSFEATAVQGEIFVT